jgi:membrane protease YdiL (CAAX protease family)
MLASSPVHHAPGQPRHALPALLIVAAVLVFSVVFLILDNAYYRFASARFPAVGDSTGLATLWGLVSRAHLIVLAVPLLLWRPRLFGLQVGRISQHWRLLLIMLLANCGVIVVYLWLTQSGTPYSGNQWLLTEVVTVPLVEETMWRGLVFTVLVLVLQKSYAPTASRQMAVWLSGLAFGLLHAGNILAGVPVSFVIIQVLNAVVWGVVYGYARERTDSLYPPILLHAAMNLVVILF